MASPGREGGVPGAGPGPGAGKEREMRRERPQAPVGEESGGWLHRDQSAARRGAGASCVEGRSWTPGSTEGARRGGRNAGLRGSGPRLGGAPTHRSRRQAVHVGSGHRSPPTAGRVRPTSQLQRLCRQRAAAAVIRLRLAPPPSQPYDLSPLTPPTNLFPPPSSRRT